MIHSKPKVSTLTSLILFALALIFALGYVFNLYWFEGTRNTWTTLSLALLIPTTLLILGKIILGYKTIQIHKDTFTITYPFRLMSIRKKLIELQSWEEIQIKTSSGLYREVELIFADSKKKRGFSKQEHEAYDRILAYLQRKAPEKQIGKK